MSTVCGRVISHIERFAAAQRKRAAALACAQGFDQVTVIGQERNKISPRSHAKGREVLTKVKILVFPSCGFVGIGLIRSEPIATIDSVKALGVYRPILQLLRVSCYPCLMISKLATVTLLCLLALVLPVRASKCFPLSKGAAAGNYLVPGVRGALPYLNTGQELLTLDAYVQPQGRAARPAVVILNGSWQRSGKVAFIGSWLELLTKAGYQWFVVDYRRDSRQDLATATADVQAALQFIRCHARALQVDPQKIVLLGEDVGALVAANVARQPAVPLQGLVLIGGLYAKALPATTSRMPATLVIHGANDSEVLPAQAQRFCNVLPGCEFIAVDQAIHRAENWTPAQWGYRPRLVEWLNKLTHWQSGSVDYLTKTALQKDIVFDQANGLKLDLYVPAGRRSAQFVPLVLIAHGGGWEAGDKVTYAAPLFATLAKAGFAWASIDYRLTPHVRHQEQLADVRTALHFLRANAARWQIDAQRIALLGESASGQMVAQLGTENLPGVAAVVAFYGVHDFTQMTGDFGPRSIPARLFGLTEKNEAALQTLRAYSPLFHVHAKQPPLLLIHGTADRLHTQGRALAERLRAVGAAYEMIELPDAPHGLENWEGRAAWENAYKPPMIAWLRKQLGLSGKR